MRLEYLGRRGCGDYCRYVRDMRNSGGATLIQRATPRRFRIT